MGKTRSKIRSKKPRPKAKSKPKKLVPAKSKSKVATVKTKQKSAATKSQRITSSGDLILLGDQFYSCISYKESSSGNFGGSEIMVVIRVGAAALVKLKSALGRGSSLSYTYRNTSGTGNVRDYQVETTGRSTTVALTLTNSHPKVNPSLIPAYSDGTRRLSANDIAHLAAKDILLNQPMDSILWAFFGNSLHYRPRAPGSPLAPYTKNVTPEKLRKARLIAVRELLGHRIVGEIYELSFTNGAKGVRIRFEGRSQGFGREETVKVSGVFGEAVK